MSYFNKIQTSYSDSANLDAFARLRVSEPTTLFDGKHIEDSGSFFWTTKITGNATASYEITKASYLLALTGSGQIYRQSKRRFQYQSGKSQLIVMTGNFNNSENSVQRIGYYNDNNGIFFQASGSTFGTGIRKNGVDTITSQSSWNLDVFNGSGVSGKTLDITKSQIFFFDIEWLGVGRVRYGIFQGGNPYYVNEITNINALSDVYMSNPNLPVRYEVSSSVAGGNYSLRQICSTVVSEGGVAEVGKPRSVDTGTSIALAGAGTTPTGILALRLASTGIDATVFPTSFSTINLSGAQNFATYLCLNPITASNWSWQTISDSAVQFATGSIALTNLGTKLVGTIVSSTADQVVIPLDQSTALGVSHDGISDVLVLGVTNLGAASQNFAGVINFKESI